MPLKLYATDFSPPCRAVAMVLETLGIDYEWVETHPFHGDHMKPEFLKLNPQHTVPTVVDTDGFIITESRAALAYLVRRYGNDDHPLYPKDAKERTLVDQRLYFDMAFLWHKALLNFLPRVVREKQMPTEQSQKDVKEILHWCEDFIKPTGFIAGTKQMTIADVSALATVTTFQEAGIYDPKEFPELEAWIARCCKVVKNYEKANKKGAEGLGNLYKTFLGELEQNK